jgi:hypothetical protein
MLALAAGAGFAAARQYWRGIAKHAAELAAILDTELAGDAETRTRAGAIVAASKTLGVLGRGWNRDAYARMCELCRDVPSDARFPRFYACLARIRAALRCAQQQQQYV